MTPFTSSGVGPRAAGLPTYELMGFPISPHQFSVVGSTHVEQRSPVPTLMLFGTPASPHQIAVLMPRRETAGITAARVTNAELPAPEPELSNMAILCSSACLRLPHGANPGAHHPARISLRATTISWREGGKVAIRQMVADGRSKQQRKSA